MTPANLLQELNLHRDTNQKILMYLIMAPPVALFPNNVRHSTIVFIYFTLDGESLFIMDSWVTHIPHPTNLCSESGGWSCRRKLTKAFFITAVRHPDRKHQ
jgi:hypothetical protein